MRLRIYHLMYNVGCILHEVPEDLWISLCRPTNFAGYTPGMKLYYKVRAWDYWNRSGEYSETVCSGC